MKISVLPRAALLGLCLLLISLCACNVYQERHSFDDIYEDLRRQVLTTPRTPGSEDYTVYAAIVDTGYDTHVVTLACFADGTTSRYKSTGEALLGLGQSHPEVAAATQAFLKGAAELLSSFSQVITTDLPYPNAGVQRVYLATDQWVHTVDIAPSSLNTAPEAVRRLAELYGAVDEAIDNTGMTLE